MALTRLGLNQSINLATNTTGTLAVANGGTGLSSGFINGTTNVGKILQVQNQRFTTEFSTTSSSYVDTGITKSITPSATNSKILILYGSGMNYTSSGTEMNLNCSRGSTQLNTITINLDGVGSTGGSAFMILDEPNTTSSVTYKVQLKRSNGSGNVYVSVNNSLSTFTLMEIGA